MKKLKLILGFLLILTLGLTACNNETGGDTGADNPDVQEDANGAGGGELTLLRSYQAPHGDKAFARVVVALDGDKIVDVAMDEFQYMDEDSGMQGVPNSDLAFGEGSQEGKILVSKLANNKEYSAMMMDKAQATLTYEENMQAIIDFAKGKTAADLEKELEGATDGEPMDAISGATFVDTPAYVRAIVDTIKEPLSESKGTAEDFGAITMVFGQASGNRENDVNDSVMAMEGDKIVAASIDEIYYMENGEGLPNSDGAFGENYADANSPLSSKLVNNNEYSAAMMDIAKATLTYEENIKGIEDFLAGKTMDEVKEVLDAATPGEPIDAISGATFANATTYLQAVLDAAK